VAVEGLYEAMNDRVARSGSLPYRLMIMLARSTCTEADALNVALTSVRPLFETCATHAVASCVRMEPVGTARQPIVA
jgi:hypothetical protein